MLAGCETVFSLITRHHSSHNKVLSRSLLLSCRRLTCDCLCAGRVPGTAIRVCQSVGMRPGDQESGAVLPVCHFPSPHATVRREHYLTISDSKHHNHRVISVCHDISLIIVPSFLREDIFSWRVLTPDPQTSRPAVHSTRARVWVETGQWDGDGPGITLQLCRTREKLWWAGLGQNYANVEILDWDAS